jgi:hypothetical protein
MPVMKTRVMYIERGGFGGQGRIGRVTLSKTGHTLYYQGRSFASLNGSGYKTTHFDEETREEYWISGPRKDGQDTLYPREVEIDDDVREEYWMKIRKRPDLVAERTFRSLGRHAKHSTR